MTVAADATLRIGRVPLGAERGHFRADGLTKPDYLNVRTRWGVYENNKFIDSELKVENRSGKRRVARL